MKWQRFEIWPLPSNKNSSDELRKATVVWAHVPQEYFPLSGSSLYQSLTHHLDRQANWPEQALSAFECSYLPGLTQTTGQGYKQACLFEIAQSHPEITGKEWAVLTEKLQVFTGEITFFEHPLCFDQKVSFERNHCNPLIQFGVWKTASEYLAQQSLPPRAYAPSSANSSFQTVEVKTIALENFLSLQEKNQLHQWGLSDEELKAIQAFYLHPHTQKARRERHLPLAATDLEMEVIAQSWSEHCKHKIFRARIEHTDEISGEVSLIDGLFTTFIKGTSEQIIRDNHIDWTVSLFKDNAGVVNFDGVCEIALKVETHNTPSVLDAYGGALTGILGVNRDIMGTGLGARPVANMNMLVLGDLQTTAAEMPSGTFTPKQMLEGVHRGLVDGGNKSGIPTLNGSMSFYPEYNERPLIYCGTIGVMKSGEHRKSIHSGDLIVMVGGRIGRDGIHGATASSHPLESTTSSSIVQLGDPFTQKKLSDFLQVARNQKLYCFITDNGAGGLSSSIGEMALEAGGAQLELSSAPLKVMGMSAWEIIISESQERMSLSVLPEHFERLKELALDFEVELTNLGHFNQSGNFSIYWKSELIGELPLNFLHEGLPQMQLRSRWKNGALSTLARRVQNPLMDQASAPQELRDLLLEILRHPNVANKSKLTSQFDQEVQGASRATPYKQAMAGAIHLAAQFELAKGELLIAHGLSSPLSLTHPKIAAARSVDEAIRNLVVHGVPLGQIALTDNFCTPDPLEAADNALAQEKLGALVEMNRGMSEAALAYAAPFISGKDSMKNDYKAQGQRRSIAPCLLTTSLGYLAENAPLIFGAFQSTKSQLFILGAEDATLAGSLLELSGKIQGQVADQPHYPELQKNARLYRRFHQAIQSGLIRSAQDISEGGAWVSLVEMSLAAKMGATLVCAEDPLTVLLSEGTGGFVIEVSPQHVDRLKSHFSDWRLSHIGETSAGSRLEIRLTCGNSLSWELTELDGVHRSFL